MAAPTAGAMFILIIIPIAVLSVVAITVATEAQATAESAVKCVTKKLARGFQKDLFS